MKTHGISLASVASGSTVADLSDIESAIFKPDGTEKYVTKEEFHKLRMKVDKEYAAKVRKEEIDKEYSEWIGKDEWYNAYKQVLKSRIGLSVKTNLHIILSKENILNIIKDNVQLGHLEITLDKDKQEEFKRYWNTLQETGIMLTYKKYESS